MNLKMTILSNWKWLLLVIQLSIIVVQLIAATPLGDPIDDPIIPGLAKKILTKSGDVV